MQEKLIKKATFFATIFALVSFSGMMAFATNKEIVYVDKSQQQGKQVVQNILFEMPKKEILILEDKGIGAHFSLPLSNTIKDTDIVIEDNYIENKLYITINGLEQDYYAEHALNAGGTFVQGALYQYKDGVTRVELQMERLYEHHAIVKNSKLYLNFTNPRELYDRIVVLDAAHGGKDYGIQKEGIAEKDVTLAIMLKTKEKLEESGIKVYCTRIKDNTIEELDRITLANQLAADMFISIHLAEKEEKDLRGVTTVYNADYFIPKLSSIELSDAIEKNVAMACETSALGLRAGDDSNVILQQATVPAAILEAGCFSNEEERSSLMESSYQKQIAEGIALAVEESYQRIR